MLKKMIIVFIALVTVVGIALGARAVLAQEEEDATVPQFMPGGHMWGWQQEGAQPANPFGPGHMWGWQQNGQEESMPYGRGYPGAGMMGGLLDGNTLLDIVAQTLGLTAEEVVAELNQGLSIAELTDQYGADLEAIVSEFNEAHAEALQEAVDAGWLTQEQADWMQQNMEARVNARVSQPWGPGAGPGFGPGGCHFDGDEGPAGESRFGRRGHGRMHGGWGGSWQQRPAPGQGPGA